MRKSKSEERLDNEEKFLLESLHRLKSPFDRYVLTMLADAVSHGLSNDKRDAPIGRTVSK